MPPFLDALDGAATSRQGRQHGRLFFWTEDCDMLLQIHKALMMASRRIAKLPTFAWPEEAIWTLLLLERY